MIPPPPPTPPPATVAHQAQHHSTSVATLHTKASLLTPTRVTHCGRSGQLFRGRVPIFACLFFLCFFDCGDAEFWRFSLPYLGARGSAERSFPCVGGMLLCGADAEVVRHGPPLACGCTDVAPAIFDALYPLRGRPVWAFCPCPSSVVQHAPRTALLHVELADVGDLAGILILLREGGGVAL
jgi:hypothetical protein